MSIALWKTALGLAKLAAVLVIAGSGFLFWSHHRAMGEVWAAPDFAPPVRPIVMPVGATDKLGLTLGRFQRERPQVDTAPKPAAEPDIIGVLNQLGEISDAIVLFPPYEDRGMQPAIIFRWKPGQKPAGEGDVRTIRRGEALIEKADSRSVHFRVPVKYLFVGCERDAENPRAVWFVFDMKCDGTDIQKARWKLDEPVKEQPKGEEPPAATGPAPVATDKMYVGSALSSKALEPRPPPEEPVQVEPVAPRPPPEPVTVEQEPSGTLFEDEEGVFAPTEDGLEYLEKNYEKILEETRTQPYRDSEGRTGIRVVGIANASVANQFGIMKDDVILKINGIAVASQSEAVNAVKSELKKKVKIIRVTLRRRGRELDKSFDTRDPATRRAAKKAFR